MLATLNAPVAQLDRVLPSEGRGRTFESSRARQLHTTLGTSNEVPSFISETALFNMAVLPVIVTVPGSTRISVTSNRNNCFPYPCV